MALYTPRGLKIRLPINYAFALMARLYPKVSVFRILKTAEGIEHIPFVLAFVAVLICFYFRLNAIYLASCVFLGYTAGSLINLTGLYVIPGLVAVGTIYSYVSGYGLFPIITGVLTFVWLGWIGPVFYFGALLPAWLLRHALEWYAVRRAFRLSGIPITASEKSFINAYRLHAVRLNHSTDVTVSDEELKEDNWSKVFIDFATKWPQIVSRFRPD